MGCTLCLTHGGAEAIARLVQLLQFLLSLFLQALIVLGNPIGMPDKDQIFISLVHLFHGCPRLKTQYSVTVVDIVHSGRDRVSSLCLSPYPMALSLYHFD